MPPSSCALRAGRCSSAVRTAAAARMPPPCRPPRTRSSGMKPSSDTNVNRAPHPPRARPTPRTAASRSTPARAARGPRYRRGCQDGCIEIELDAREADEEPHPDYPPPQRTEQQELEQRQRDERVPVGRGGQAACRPKPADGMTRTVADTDHECGDRDERLRQPPVTEVASPAPRSDRSAPDLPA